MESEIVNENIPILKEEIHTVILIPLWLCPGGGGGCTWDPGGPHTIKHSTKAQPFGLIPNTENFATISLSSKIHPVLVSTAVGATAMKTAHPPTTVPFADSAGVGGRTVRPLCPTIRQIQCWHHKHHITTQSWKNNGQLQLALCHQGRQIG